MRGARFLIGGALVAALVFLFAPSAVLGYDAMFHVVWGNQIAHGHLPQYDTLTAPTPHPLQLLLATVLAPLGDAAPDGFRIVHLLSAGALAVGIYLVGRMLFSPIVGVVAALLLVTRPFIIELAHRGAADLPALALVVWAAVLELRRPRRGVAPLVLLALAGLLRPEAWLFAFAYTAWCFPGRSNRARAGLAALALSAPVLWALMDLVVAGDPTWSYTLTHDITERINRQTGLVNGVKLLPRNLDEILGLIPLVVGAAGLVAGVVLLRARTLPLAAVAILSGAAFLALAAGKLSLQPRYLLVAVAAIALLAAVAALGWTSLPPDHAWYGRWRAAGIVALAALVTGAALEAGETRDTHTALTGPDRGLQRLLRSDRASAALEGCSTVGVPAAVMVPFVTYTLDLPSKAVIFGWKTPGAFVAAGPGVHSYLSGGAEGAPLRATPKPDELPLVADEDGWRMYASCSLSAAPRATPDASS